MAEEMGPHKDAVLVVEDDTDLRESLAQLIGLRGYRVLAAANGREALDLIGRDGPPCLILLDLMMPVMDGWTFRESLLGNPQLSQVPVVLLSGVYDVAEEARRLLAADYLLKPVSSRAVLDVVEQHC